MRKLFIALATLFLLAGCGNSATTENAYETIDISKIEDYVAKQWQVVDVREIEEYNASHIPDAINQPLSVIQQGDFGSLSKEANYIIICKSGNRSQHASAVLAEKGFNIVNVQQGMSSWTGDLE
ncbi:MAG: rhodanese-like domain-containing protein [Lysinibacillus sp.]